MKLEVFDAVAEAYNAGTRSGLAELGALHDDLRRIVEMSPNTRAVDRLAAEAVDLVTQTPTGILRSPGSSPTGPPSMMRSPRTSTWTLGTVFPSTGTRARPPLSVGVEPSRSAGVEQQVWNSRWGRRLPTHQRSA
ncbi:hypothetical protein ACH4SP_07020 [Streptomyces sp. NPDC021093]|uniref:hypothetical protein n=1 Tax=Streptomyces sp. NPDC021093 TaxID=3365112 RepID=UPI0037B8879A